MYPEEHNGWNLTSIGDGIFERDATKRIRMDQIAEGKAKAAFKTVRTEAPTLVARRAYERRGKAVYVVVFTL